MGAAGAGGGALCARLPLGSVAAADALLSWNFKQMVQLRRVRGFHAVNVLRGYPLIEIRLPLELIDDEA